MIVKGFYLFYLFHPNLENCVTYKLQCESPRHLNSTHQQSHGILHTNIFIGHIQNLNTKY